MVVDTHGAKPALIAIIARHTPGEGQETRPHEAPERRNKVAV